MAYRIGVDIGGTFTDCVAIGDDGRMLRAKVLSTHATDPADGVLDGVAALAEEAGLDTAGLLAQTDWLSHGTTIGTNLLVERKGARVALVATAGHGDALAMMRGAGRTAGVPIEEVYSVHRTDKPAPLVPRALVAEVPERVDAAGQVLAPLDEDAARAVLRDLLGGSNGDRPDAVAVALLWSVRNPVHEERLRDLIREVAPDAFVSLSSETSRRQGEYERTVATVVNSYVGPASSRYLARLTDRLADQGLERAPLVMQANGGVVPIAVAQRQPSALIGSGPAGGLAGTAALARHLGHAHVIATDMGGTSFEVGLIVDGAPILAEEQIIDRYTYHQPRLDTRSIACGGGSIARADAHTGSLRVGPESAGSSPGPACYGGGGTEATVTDADVVLGLLDDSLLGGGMRLDVEAARAAVGRVADALGLGLEEAAAGILRVNDHAAATLIRRRTLERGLDPRDFVLYAYGGAGPVHAFGYASELGVREVVVPLGNGASTFSAYGIAASEVVRVFDQECALRAPIDMDALHAIVEEVQARAHAAFDEHDVGGAPRFEASALMRYAEQYLNSIAVPLEADRPGGDLVERFTAEYGRLYGAGATALFQAAEIFAVRVRATVAVGDGIAGPGAAAAGAPAGDTRIAEREVFWPKEGRRLPTAVHDGERIGEQTAITGPALAVLPHTTVAVAPGQRLTGGPGGSLHLTVEGA